MNPLPIGVLCLLGAGFIAFWCAFSRQWWPLMAIAALLAVIVLQLRSALIADGQHHDLSAWTAMTATVIPALAGVLAGAAAGQRLGQGLTWRSWQGVVTAALLVAAGWAVVAAMVV